MTINPAWADRSENISELAAALIEAQAQMLSIVKGRTANAGAYGYQYADLSDVIGSTRPVLAVHGIVLTQTAETNDHDVMVWSTLLHRSGQYITGQPIRLPVGKTAQNTGSAITYARRYSMLAILGLAAGDDDDGAQATPRDERLPQAITGTRQRRTEHIEPKQPTDTARTDDERWIRAQLAALDSETSKILREAFKAEFGSTLSDLAPAGHQSARAWVAECLEKAPNA